MVGGQRVLDAGVCAASGLFPVLTDVLVFPLEIILNQGPLSHVEKGECFYSGEFQPL